MKVFICEDDEDILQLLAIILESPNLAIVSCKSVVGAFAAIKNTKPDLLIMDYWLDNTKVDSLVLQVRQDEQLRTVPIVLISAVDNLEAVGARLTVDAIVKKPFDIHALKSTVFELLPS